MVRRVPTELTGFLKGKLLVPQLLNELLKLAGRAFKDFCMTSTAPIPEILCLDAPCRNEGQNWFYWHGVLHRVRRNGL